MKNVLKLHLESLQPRREIDNLAKNAHTPRIPKSSGVGVYRDAREHGKRVLGNVDDAQVGKVDRPTRALLQKKRVQLSFWCLVSRVWSLVHRITKFHKTAKFWVSSGR